MKTCGAHTASSQSQLRMSPAAWSNCTLIGCDVARQNGDLEIDAGKNEETGGYENIWKPRLQC